jgi:hypothetical protein
MAEKLGDKLGPRLAQLAGQYATAARRDHAPIEAKIRQVATQALIDKAGHEFADHIGPLLERAIEANPDMDETVRDYLVRTASGKHQLQAIAGHIAMAGAGSVLSTLLSNELAPLAYGIVAANPHLRLDAPTAAAARAIGTFTQGDQYNESAASGFNSVRSDVLYNLAQAVPDSATIGQLVNRGLLSEQDAMFWIQRGGYGQALHSVLLALKQDVLSPADAALAVLRTEMSQSEGAAKAALSGVDAADFNTLVLNTGEPPGAESLMEALRRGFIDQARFEHGIVQSRIRNEWIDVLTALRYSPMSIADAVNSVIQGYQDEAQAAAIAEQNGLEPGQIDVLIETAGEPLSRTELEQLFNRGLIDQATVEQGIRESRVKNKYIPDALALHVRLPEPRQIVSAIRYGAISQDDGAKLLTQYGYTPDVVGVLIATGLAEKTGAAKELTLAEIKTLYIDGIFTVGQATSYAQLLGYDDTEMGYLIAAWNFSAQAANTRQAVGVIRSRFIARVIDWTEAAAALTSLGIPDAAQSTYQATWLVEQSVRLATLTPAQIVAAVKKDLIGPRAARDRLIAEHGYTADDANILLGYLPGAEVPETAALPNA